MLSCLNELCEVAILESFFQLGLMAPVPRISETAEELRVLQEHQHTCDP